MSDDYFPGWFVALVAIALILGAGLIAGVIALVWKLVLQ